MAEYGICVANDFPKGKQGINKFIRIFSWKREQSQPADIAFGWKDDRNIYRIPSAWPQSVLAITCFVPLPAPLLKLIHIRVGVAWGRTAGYFWLSCLGTVPNNCWDWFSQDSHEFKSTPSGCIETAGSKLMYSASVRFVLIMWTSTVTDQSSETKMGWSAVLIKQILLLKPWQIVF